MDGREQVSGESDAERARDAGGKGRHDGAESDQLRAEFIAAHDRLHAWTLRFFMAGAGRRASVAEDLVQRTWSAAWKAVSTGVYDPARSSMTTFVHGVAHTIARGAATEFTRQANRPKRGVWPEPEGLDLGEEAARAEAVDQVRAALRGDAPGADLTEEEIGVLQLVSRGLGDRELAAQLGVAPSTANARKRAAIQKLAAHLNREPAPTRAIGLRIADRADAGERAGPVRQSLDGGA